MLRRAQSDIIDACLGKVLAAVKLNIANQVQLFAVLGDQRIKIKHVD